MRTLEEFVGKRTIEAANVYGEGEHLYNMWLDTDEPIVRCRDCENHLDVIHSCKHFSFETYDRTLGMDVEVYFPVEPDGFCKWGVLDTSKRR